MGKYEEALERAKELHESGNALTKLQMEIVFPVLKESEDERIKRFILTSLNYLIGVENSPGSDYDKQLKEAYSWLEKQKEQKPAEKSENPIIPEWSEEDEKHRESILKRLDGMCKHGATFTQTRFAVSEDIDWLKSLRPQPKQESEPLEIKYAEKIYKVYGTKELPGGVVGYIIEDEPGHYDCIIHPDEVFGGGYGIKSNGSPYPTKEANFGQPHWKPSEEQLKCLGECVNRAREMYNASANGYDAYPTLSSLLHDLRSL